MRDWNWMSGVEGGKGGASFLHSRLVNSDEKSAVTDDDDNVEEMQAAELMSDLRIHEGEKVGMLPETQLYFCSNYTTFGYDKEGTVWTASYVGKKISHPEAQHASMR